MTTRSQTPCLYNIATDTPTRTQRPCLYNIATDAPTRTHLLFLVQHRYRYANTYTAHFLVLHSHISTNVHTTPCLYNIATDTPTRTQPPFLYNIATDTPMCTQPSMLVQHRYRHTNTYTTPLSCTTSPQTHQHVH